MGRFFSPRHGRDALLFPFGRGGVMLFLALEVPKFFFGGGFNRGTKQPKEGPSLTLGEPCWCQREKAKRKGQVGGCPRSPVLEVDWVFESERERSQTRKKTPPRFGRGPTSWLNGGDSKKKNAPRFARSHFLVEWR